MEHLNNKFNLDLDLLYKIINIDIEKLKNAFYFLLSKKQLYGQFFTTNQEYILQGMFIPDNITKIIEPFTGNGDLLNFITNINKYKLECYDIDPKKDFIIKKDTLLNPPNYNNSFIITNPPYLARNKSSNKNYFDKYDVNDLYKCFIK